MSDFGPRLRALRFFGRLGRAAAPPGIVEVPDQKTPGGVAFDLYRPRGPTRGVVVALHGVTVNGRRDHRLVHFAQTLASSGVACLVPTLEGLARCRWTTADIDATVECAGTAATLAPCPVTLIGFSFGGGYALVAAGRPALRGRLGLVLTFGAHYCLEDLLDRMAAADEIDLATEDEWDNFAYLRLALADRYREALGIPPPLWPEIESLLRRYCDVAPAEEKRRFYRAHLAHLPIARLAHESTDRGVTAQLSPRGHLLDVGCPVAVVHDPHDTIVPVAQAARIDAELPPDVPHELVVTGLLSHVTLRAALRLGEIAQLVRVVAPLFRAAR